MAQQKAHIFMREYVISLLLRKLLAADYFSPEMKDFIHIR
jgi:hypothetical protein